MTDNSIDRISGYHAHVYFAAETESAATALREALDKNFAVTLGRWHHKPVGPHPQSMYQVAFEPDQFAALVPFLALNRGPLTILVHPQTDDAYADHMDYAMWLGDRLELDLSNLRRAKQN